MSNNYAKISVKEETYSKFKETAALIKRRNPTLENVNLSEDFMVNWLIEAYNEKLI